MLEKLVLDREVTKEEYRARLPALEMELFDLERRAKAAKIPTIVVFEGLEAAGKGTSIRVLTERLDPRALRIYPIQQAREHELERPWLWRFWMKLPNDGEMAIFDTSWYRHVLEERMTDSVKRRELEEAFHEINEFEHQLADDGHVLIKFWLHISRREQKRRLERAESDPTAFFDVSKAMWKQNKGYEKWVKAIEEMLERTESEWAPWTIVESTDRRFARLKIFETVISSLKARLSQMPDAPPPLPALAEALAKLRAGEATSKETLESLHEAETQAVSDLRLYGARPTAPAAGASEKDEKGVKKDREKPPAPDKTPAAAAAGGGQGLKKEER